MGQIIEVIERYELPDFPELELPEEDGVPLESPWHRAQMNLLIDVLHYHWRGRQDYYVGGNMFVYYSVQQARNRDYKGPDFFVVKNVDGSYERRKWVVWEEDGHYPDAIIELLSPSTAAEDLGSKKKLYEQTFNTGNYFCYDPDEKRLWGWRHVGSLYEPIEPDNDGRMWSDVLEAWIGIWGGEYLNSRATWLRLFDEDGNLIPTEAEAERRQVETERLRAEAEKRRAEGERRRAEAAEAEVARLKAEVARLRQA